MIQSERGSATLSGHERVGRIRTFFECAIAFVLGTPALLVPVLIDPGRRRYPAAVFPFIGDAVEGLKPVSLFLLLLLGCFVGFFGRASALLLAVSAVAVFPIWSILDLALGSEGHNLLPFEWMFYAFYGSFVLLGVGAGRSVRRAVFPSV